MINSKSDNISIKIDLFNSNIFNIKALFLWCIFAGSLCFFFINFDFTYFIFHIYTYLSSDSDSYLFYCAVIFLYIYFSAIYIFVLCLTTLLFESVYLVNNFPHIKFADMLLNVNSKIPCAVAFAVVNYIIYTLENSMSGGLFVGHIKISYVFVYLIILGFAISLCLGFYKSKRCDCGFRESKIIYVMFLIMIMMFCWSHAKWLVQASDFYLFNPFPFKHLYFIATPIMLFLEFIICCINNDIKWLKIVICQ